MFVAGWDGTSEGAHQAAMRSAASMPAPDHSIVVTAWQRGASLEGGVCGICNVFECGLGLELFRVCRVEDVVGSSVQPGLSDLWCDVGGGFQTAGTGIATLRPNSSGKIRRAKTY